MKLITAFCLLISSNIFAAESIEYLPVPSSDLVRHTYYTLSYNEEFEQANWVYYILTDSMVLKGGEERSNYFRMDKLVPTGSAKSSDYTKSGFDRGHLCPAADMGFSPISMAESFLMSNISPQTPGFNRGIWKELESMVRDWAQKEGKIVVVTGPVFKNNKRVIGASEVMVPGFFFKVIYDVTDDPKLIAFVFPNEKSDRPLADFAVATDEVERLSGFDFFSQLPDELENRLEAKVELAGWFEEYKPEKQLAEQSELTEEPARNEPGNELKFYSFLILIILLAILAVSLRSRKKR